MSPTPAVKTGLECFLEASPRSRDGRLGLLCNPASVDHRFHHARDLMARRFPGKITALFSPQHGFFSEKQDNMIESDDMRDPVLDVPIFSLYGRTRRPTREMFAHIDTLLVDLQDVGTRVYTFIYTLSYCLEAAREFNKAVIILDRPNPIGGTRVEGNCLTDDCTSFVGRYPIPMRHGMTIGELARLFNETYGIGCALTVVPMQGWRRHMLFTDTGLPWVPPSPNLPTPAAALVYPGQVLWEGTNISEGRGTTQPFELFGAPFIDPPKLLARLDAPAISGVTLRPVGFEPTSNKWHGSLCRGFQLHVTDPESYRPYQTSLSLLQAVISLYGNDFAWKKPPYEYEYHRLPIDLIIGDSRIRQRVETLENMGHIAQSWQAGTDQFEKIRSGLLLY